MFVTRDMLDQQFIFTSFLPKKKKGKEKLEVKVIYMWHKLQNAHLTTEAEKLKTTDSSCERLSVG